MINKEIAEDKDYLYLMLSTKRTRKSSKKHKPQSKLKREPCKSVAKCEGQDLDKLKKENKILKEENLVFQEYFKVFEKKYQDREEQIGKLQ